MGGQGSGRPPKPENLIKRQQDMSARFVGEEMVLPNFSGDHSAGKVLTTPVDDYDIANKKYVDDNIGGAVEGVDVLSTGESGGTKFLREDGDGTCSWQSPAGGGDALTTDPLSQFAATTSAQLAGVISDETGSGSLVFASGATLIAPALGTPASGDLQNCSAYPSASIDHDATTNFAANEHFTEASIDHTAITNIGTNTHAQIDTHIGTTFPALSGSHYSLSGAYYTHAADTSDPHGSNITQTNAVITTLSGSNILNTGDHNTSGSAYVVGVIMDPSATPPTASGFPYGTIYLQYTA